MFCPRCGTQNEVGAANCLRCGSALPQPQSAKPPEPSAAPPTSGNISSGDLPDSSEGTFISGSSSVSDAPNYPGPPGQSPYGGAPQDYGSGQGGAPGYGAGAPQGPYSGGSPGYGSGQQGYGGSSGYGGAPSYGGGPGYGGAAPPPGGNVPNYLVWSIISTVAGLIFCCLIGLPMGIVAIVFSTQVNNKLQAGDYAGALEASNKAKLWCIISSVASALGLIGNIIILLSGGFR
jgi:hypothetical protein